METTFRFACSSCGKGLRAKSTYVGKKARCSCGNEFLVPSLPLPDSEISSRAQKTWTREVTITSGILFILALVGLGIWQQAQGESHSSINSLSLEIPQKINPPKDVPIPKTLEPDSKNHELVEPVVFSEETSLPRPAEQGTELLRATIKTNVYGGTLVVQRLAEEVVRTPFRQLSQELQIEIPDDGKLYNVMIELAGVVTSKTDHYFASDEMVEIKFEETQFTILQRAAACLLVIPGGGFGSGFLMGDRQTIATAAHCVACQDVRELEIVFHPTEPRETRLKGARIIYFDAKQDVALLHLPTAVPGYHPYFWANRAVEKSEVVTILGNPGRAGYPDPMYSRSAIVQGARPDEFYIDIEVKPGYSGGPVILENSMNAVGITSYKYINTENYEQNGQSFAKSAKIAADAYSHWLTLSAQLKNDKLVREERQYQERFLFVEANEVATAVLSDSMQFLDAINAVIEDYNQHMEIALSQLPNPVSEASYRRAQSRAHREYLREKAPKMAQSIRERISPYLLLEQGYHERYVKILKDPELPQQIKTNLTQAHEHYETLREALENVVTPSKRSSSGKTLIEFAEFIVDELNGALFHCRQIFAECEAHLQ